MSAWEVLTHRILAQNLYGTFVPPVGIIGLRGGGLEGTPFARCGSEDCEPLGDGGVLHAGATAADTAPGLRQMVKAAFNR